MLIIIVLSKNAPILELNVIKLEKRLWYVVLSPIYARKNFLENLLNFIFWSVWNRSPLLS